MTVIDKIFALVVLTNQKPPLGLSLPVDAAILAGPWLTGRLFVPLEVRDDPARPNMGLAIFSLLRGGPPCTNLSRAATS